jgi:hypothetical protein
MEWRTLHSSWSQLIYESCDHDSRWSHLEAGQQMPATLQDKVNYRGREGSDSFIKTFLLCYKL